MDRRRPWAFRRLDDALFQHQFDFVLRDLHPVGRQFPHTVVYGRSRSYLDVLLRSVFYFRCPENWRAGDVQEFGEKTVLTGVYRYRLYRRALFFSDTFSFVFVLSGHADQYFIFHIDRQIIFC